VGCSETTSTVADEFAFSYVNGKMTNLGTLGGDDSFASGINDAGQIVGGAYASTTGFVLDAFLYQNGKMTALPSLGYLQYPNSYAYAINKNGVIVGYSTDPSATQRACIWQNGTVTNIDTLDSGGSAAGAINSAGVVVGTVNDSFDPIDDPVNDAFVYENGIMTDLNTLIPANTGWVLEYANGINDSGEIAGWGLLNGVERGFLLTPTN
jgi:probable HAF family extracellular repeat protein